MFAPPPVPSLSKAEIEARRARVQASQNHEADSRSTSSGLKKQPSPSSSSSEHSRIVGPTIVRKIGRLGVGKHEKKHSVVISNPLPSQPPSTRLPSPPSLLVRHSPPVPAAPESVNLIKQKVSPGERVHLPIGPPKRPPRPAGNLSTSDQSKQSLNVHRSISGTSTDSKQSTASFSSDSFRSSSSVQELEGAGFDGVLEALRNIGSGAGAASGDLATGAQRRPLQNDASEKHVPVPRLSELPRSSDEGDMKFGSSTNRGHKESRTSNRTRIVIPDVSKLTDKALPDTPKSILQTPTNFYAKGIAATQSAEDAEHFKQHAQTDRDLDVERPSKSTQRKTLSGSSTPSAVQIQLRTGSLVIVTTPEMNAWRRCCYTQGPIKLNKPNVMPRKNSVASLEAFQDAIDQVYEDNASLASRRRGDEAAIDEICEYFLSFGLGSIQYDGDVLAVDGGAISEESEDEAEQAGMVNFETPPGSPSLFKTMLDMLRIDLPPIENEETLRAKGIARLAKLRSQATSTAQSDLPTSTIKPSAAEGKTPSTRAGELEPVPTTLISTSDQAIKDVQPSTVVGADAGSAMPFVPWVSSFRSQNLFKIATRPKRFST